jgi:hypothetical protein
VFGVAVSAGDVRIARGEAPDAALRLRTDPVTLVQLLRAELSQSEAVAAGRITADGPDEALGRFLQAFAWPARAALVPA